jgi:hypothetical protein
MRNDIAKSPDLECITTVCLVLYGLALAGATFLFFRTWDQPIVDQHGFRQTQTALTVYWGIVDGWRLAYLTPVVGAPWSVPFEFPLFQWVVSAVWKATDLPLDNCGRAASFAFHVGSSLLVAALLMRLKCSRAAAWVGATAFLVAPVNLFWGRAFLIESCALFLSLAYMCLAISAIQEESPHTKARVRRVVLTTALSTAAALTKITTFLIPVGIVGLYALAVVIERLRRSKSLASRYLVSEALVYGFPVLVALSATATWVGFSDQIKSEGIISSLLQSANLSAWNFGTLQQRFSEELWRQAMWQRSVYEATGHYTALALAGLVALLVRGRMLYLSGLFLLAYLGSFLLFPNLHTIHNYYQYAAAVWLICAAALVLSATGRKSVSLFFAATALLFAQQVTVFRNVYLPVISAQIEPNTNRSLGLGQILRNRVPPDGVVVTFGNDWSSDIAYYSGRRTVAVPGWGISPTEVLDQLSRLTKPYGAVLVVDCNQSSAQLLVGRIDAIRSGPSESFLGCTLTPINPG